MKICNTLRRRRRRRRGNALDSQRPLFAFQTSSDKQGTHGDGMPRPIHRRAGREAQSGLRIEFRSEPPQMRKTGPAAVTALHLQLGRVMTDRTFSHSCSTTNALLATLCLCVFHTSHERSLERPLTFDTLGFAVVGGGVSSFFLHSQNTENITDQENSVPSGGRSSSRDCARYRVSAAPAARRLCGPTRIQVNSFWWQ